MVAGAAVWQLGLQRRQLREQQKDIARQAAQLERQQANLVDVTPRVVNGAQAGVLAAEDTLSVHAVMVTNGSGRPIRDVVATICTDHPSFKASPSRLNFAHRIGEFVDAALAPGTTAEQLMTSENTDRLRVLPARRRGAMVFPFNTRDYLNPKFTVRFTDDAGLNWQIDNDLHLTGLDSRADW